VLNTVIVSPKSLFNESFKLKTVELIYEEILTNSALTVLYKLISASVNFPETALKLLDKLINP
jgi:hypothetical protein